MHSALIGALFMVDEQLFQPYTYLCQCYSIHLHFYVVNPYPTSRLPSLAMLYMLQFPVVLLSSSPIVLASFQQGEPGNEAAIASSTASCLRFLTWFP